jgi:hypothetical protein
MFASKVQIHGGRANAQDDLESFFYLLAFLYNDGFLPWSDVEHLH